MPSDKESGIPPRPFTSADDQVASAGSPLRAETRGTENCPESALS